MKKKDEEGERKENGGEERRNEDNEKKVDGREKWNVKGGGEGVRGYRKMGRGARFDTRVLAPHFYPVLVGRRSFSRGVDDPRRQFSSYPGEYAEARKGSRVYPLFPWLASYGYTFIRR